MNSLTKLSLIALTCGSLLATDGFGQLGQQKGPASKLFLSETKGSGTIENNGQVFEPKQGTAFDATGTVMVTNKDSHQAYVLSTGTGMYLDANTHVQVNQFDQDRFQPNQKPTDVEPSVSHINIAISRGLVGVCASQMVSGTTLVFTTPLASVNVRGHRVAIQVTPGETIVYDLEGSVTVRTGDKDAGGVTLQPGERAVVRPGSPGQAAVTTVAPMDNDTKSLLDGTVTVACNARKTVAFEAVDAKGGGDEEIVAKPTVATTPPNNLTVSPDRINPGT
jgi:uncharacterized cupin superfamily protein